MSSRTRLTSVDEGDEGSKAASSSQVDSSVENKDSPSAFDLLPKLAPYLDLHMVFPLIAYAEELKNVYKPEDLLRAKVELLEFTNLVDYAVNQWTSSTSEPAPQQMIERRQAVVDTLKALTADAQPLLDVVNDANVLKGLKETGNFNMAYLEEAHGVTPSVLESYFAYGKFKFECGNYEESKNVMSLYRELDSEERSEKSFDALWGKLASEILMIVAQSGSTAAQAESTAKAFADLKELQKILDAKDSDPLHPPNQLEQLQFRSWMLHWSLFVFFHQSEGRSNIVDFFLTTPRHRNVIETLCPWLLRYVVAAMIANRNRKPHLLQMLVQIVEQEHYEYSDPITELLECLLLNFDFERALATLARCERVLRIDYFLAGLRQDFVDSARTMIFETHCRLNSRIDISMLRSKLDMSSDEAEKWIVDLVRNAKLDAKIDLETNSVVMGASQVLVWEGVWDKTKDLTWRTSKISGGILKMQQDGLMH